MALGMSRNRCCCRSDRSWISGTRKRASRSCRRWTTAGGWCCAVARYAQSAGHVISIKRFVPQQVGQINPANAGHARRPFRRSHATQRVFDIVFTGRSPQPGTPVKDGSNPGFGAKDVERSADKPFCKGARSKGRQDSVEDRGQRSRYLKKSEKPNHPFRRLYMRSKGANKGNLVIKGAL